MNAVTDGGTYSSGGSGGGLGYVRLQDHSAKVLRIGTCYKPIEIPNNDYTCCLNKTNYTYFENDIQVIEWTIFTLIELLVVVALNQPLWNLRRNWDKNLSFFTDAVSDDETPDLLLLLFSS